MRKQSFTMIGVAHLIAGIIFLLSSTAVNASHFRGATMIPSVDADGLLTLTSTSFWRPTAPSNIDEGGNPLVSGVGSMADFGSSVQDTSDSRFTKVTNVHTLQLPGAGTYNISASSCCRVGGIINASESTWTMNSTIVWDGVNAHTPIQFNFSAVQPEVVRGANYNDNLGAVAAQGLTLTYDQALNQNINSQPPGFTIDSNTGALFIPSASTTTYLDNPSSNLGADYAFSGNIIASDGSNVEFDWLFDAVATGSTNNAPDVDDAVLNIYAGDQVEFTMTGSDPDGDTLTWSLDALLGLWGSAPNSPSFNPATQVFSWDSTGAPLGSYFAHIEAVDPGGLTDIGILTINVQQPTPTPVPSPTEPPTAVSLVGFEAKVNGDGSVTLAWETASEVDNAGFNIYRSKRSDGTYKKVNGKLIPAQGSSAHGDSYSFEDTPGSGAFYYKLEDVDYNGVSVMHGPVKVRVRSAESDGRRRR